MSWWLHLYYYLNVFIHIFLIFVRYKRFCVFLYLQHFSVKKKFKTGLMTLVILLLSSQLAIIRSKYNNNEKEYWILRKALPVNFLKPLIGVCTPWYWILEINIRDRSQKVWKNVNKCWPRIRGQGRVGIKGRINFLIPRTKSK